MSGREAVRVRRRPGRRAGATDERSEERRSAARRSSPDRSAEGGGARDLVERISGHHLWLGVLASVIVAAGVIVGVGRLAGYARLGDALGDADPGWLVLCVLGQGAVFVGYAGAVRATIAADDGPSVPTGPAIRLVFASFAATQLLAFGGVGGLALLYWALRRVGMDRTESAVRLIGLNTAVYLAFGGLGWFAALTCLVLARAPLGLTLPWLAVFPLALVLARWFTEPGRVDRWDPRHVEGWRRALGTGIGAAGWVRRQLGVAEGRPLFAWCAAYWVGDVLSLWAALHSVGARVGLASLVLAYTTGYLAQSLPIPFIATGGVDAATTFVLHILGVPLELALAGVLAHRLFAFWLPVVPGAAFALTLPRLGRSLAGDDAVVTQHRHA